MYKNSRWWIIDSLHKGGGRSWALVSRNLMGLSQGSCQGLVGMIAKNFDVDFFGQK